MKGICVGFDEIQTRPSFQVWKRESIFAVQAFCLIQLYLQTCWYGNKQVIFMEDKSMVQHFLQDYVK